MKQFTITDDFPSNQATFDLRFNTEEACNEYLFNLRWPNGFACTCCNHFVTGKVIGNFIYVPNVNINIQLLPEQ